MDSDSDLLLLLYREARTRPTPAFQDFAMGLVARRLRFDSAVWATGYRTGSTAKPALAPILALSHTHRTDPEGVARWREINRADKAIPIMLDNPLRTVQIHAPTLFCGRDDLAMLDYTRRFGRQCALVTRLSGPTSALVQWSVLYRADADHPFSTSEVAHCQGLMLHLAEALAFNRLVHGGGGPPFAPTDDASVAALVETSGHVLAAAPGFVAACRRQWRDFDGLRLPAPVVGQFTTEARDIVRLRAVVLRARRVAGLLWLTATCGEPSALPPRRMDVATLYAQGHTHKAIARTLGIAPATVRNHIAASFRALGVSDRSGLRAELRRRN